VVEAVLFNHHRSRDTQRLPPNEKAQRGAVDVSRPRVRDRMSRILRTREQGPVDEGKNPIDALKQTLHSLG
jgi:hypothetical protein